MRKRLLHLLVLVILAVAMLPSPQPAHAAVGPLCYVNAAASGANNGESWTNAYTSLQSALLDLNCTEVWVAAAIYKPGSGASDSFRVRAGTQVYGGFVGTETALSQQDWVAHLTILSGDIDNNDVVDSDGVVEDASNVKGTNSHHVVTMDGTTGTDILPDTILDGFTITAGQAPYLSGFPEGHGAGLYCKGQGAGSVCSPTLAHLRFRGNLDGALEIVALNAGTSSPIVKNVDFEGNRTTPTGGSSGGAILSLSSEAGGSSSPQLTNVTFADNSAESGGAMLTSAFLSATSNPTLTNVTFSGNSATRGGALYNSGGGSSANPILMNVTFNGNTASDSGGAIYNEQALTGSSHPSLTNVILWGDSATVGSPEAYAGSPISITYSDVQGGCASIANANCVAPNLNSDPLLGALADNGGFSQTMALGLGSPAIDAGTNSGCPATDQRGVTRPLDGDGNGTATCDMGAFEYDPGAIEVRVGGAFKGAYHLLSGQSTRQSYAGANGGPVKIDTTSGADFIAAERVIYNLGGTPYGGTPVGYSEMMGFPGDQLTDAYWIPVYNNIAFDSQLRFANAGTSATNVTVTIGASSYGPYALDPGQSTRFSLPDANGGPVQVTSDLGSKLIAAERVIYNLGGTPLGGTPVDYSEMMAYPANQVTNNYWIPVYNNIAFDSQLRFANVGASSTSVTVTIGTTSYGPYPLASGESQRLSLPDANGGPVLISSPSGSEIVASERVIYNLGGTPLGGTPVGYSEMMAYPADQVTNSYWIPVYNNIAFDSQLRFANVGASSTSVTVTIGTTSYGPYPLASGESQRLSLAGANGGPVRISSPGGSEIVASERVIYNLGGTPYGGTPAAYAEMMAYPGNQLANTYWIPVYNNIAFDSQIRLAVP